MFKQDVYRVYPEQLEKTAFRCRLGIVPPSKKQMCSIIQVVWMNGQ